MPGSTETNLSRWRRSRCHTSDTVAPRSRCARRGSDLLVLPVVGSQHVQNADPARALSADLLEFVRQQLLPHELVEGLVQQ